MNILITSVGKRGYLVEYFKEAMEGTGQVHVGNSKAQTPAFDVADASVVTPLVYDPEYIPFLLDYCEKHKIGGLLSLYDLDLPVLAANRERFEQVGVRLIVSDREVIANCNDKWRTYQFLTAKGFLTAKTYLHIDKFMEALDAGEVSFPVIVKPRWGSGSLGMFEAESREELRLLRQVVERINRRSNLKYESSQDFANSVLIQECIRGAEYNLDVINDLDGNYCTTSTKLKLTVNRGSTECTRVVRDSQMEELGCKISTALRHVGNLDVDIIQDGDRMYIIDLNARFGGGYPFTHLAGVDLPRAIVAWLGRQSAREEWLRVDEEITGCMSLQPVALGE